MSKLTIADSNGHVLAQRSFDPMPRPLITNAGDILPAQVRLAAGAAYYAEPTGRVHRLDLTGTDTVVATFPLTTTQQELSFAVSPDGKQVVAIVLTFPPVHDPPPADLSQPYFKEGSRWSTEFERATSGGATESVLKTDLGQVAVGPMSFSTAITTIAGWDDVGPIALLGTQLAAQEPPPSDRMTGTALVHLGADGTHLDQLGGPGCRPLDVLPNGTTLCYTGNFPHSYEVRTSTGQLSWHEDLAASYYNPVLSPDGQRIVAQTGESSVLFAQRSVPASVARLSPPSTPQFSGLGWVGSSTLAGWSKASGTVLLVDVANLQHQRDTGLTGFFLGTL
jgi:hypothetical protein